MSIESILRSINFNSFEAVSYYYSNVLSQCELNVSSKKAILNRLIEFDNTYSSLKTHYKYIHDSLNKHNIKCVDIFNKYFSNMNDSYIFVISSLDDFLNKANEIIFKYNYKFNSDISKYECELGLLILFIMTHNNFSLEQSEDELYNVTCETVLNDNVMNDVIKSFVQIFSSNASAGNLYRVSLAETEDAYKNINNNNGFTYVIDDIYSKVINKCPLLTVIKKVISSSVYYYKIILNICNCNCDDENDNDIRIISKIMKFEI